MGALLLSDSYTPKIFGPGLEDSHTHPTVLVENPLINILLHWYESQDSHSISQFIAVRLSVLIFFENQLRSCGIDYSPPVRYPSLSRGVPLPQKLRRSSLYYSRE